MTNKKQIRAEVVEDGSVVMLNGVKAKVSRAGNVVLFTDMDVKKIPAIKKTAVKESSLLRISEESNTIFLHGVTFDVTESGLIVATNSTLDVFPAPSNEADDFYIGQPMEDGTVFAGFSPENEQPMYAALSDAPLMLDFNEAAEYARSLDVGGKRDFRVPTQAELDVLCRNIRKGALKGTFNVTGADAGYYWSSTPYREATAPYREIASVAWGQRLSDGQKFDLFRNDKVSVRCVRSVQGKKPSVTP